MKFGVQLWPKNCPLFGNFVQKVINYLSVVGGRNNEGHFRVECGPVDAAIVTLEYVFDLRPCGTE